MRRPPTTSSAVATAVLGSVCGTLVTSALDTSPTVRLVAAALGAALPPLVATAGRFRGLRVAVALAVTFGALLTTYSGFTALDYAAARASTFPLPPAAPDPDRPTTPPPTVPPTVPPTRLPGPGIAFAPSTVSCTSEGCGGPVTITSTGAARLRIDAIEVDGEAAARFGYDGDCAHRQLAPSQTCTLRVEFRQSGTGRTRHARLVINQNLPGPPTFVALSGVDGPAPRADVSVSTDGVTCVHQRAGALGGRDALQLFLPVRLTGADPGSLPGLVRLTARSDRGPVADLRTAVGDGDARTVAALPLRPTHYGRTHHVVVRVDPAGEIPEADEGNNRIRVTVELPQQPGSSVELDCAAVAG